MVAIMTITFPEFINFLNAKYPFPQNKHGLTHNSALAATTSNPCYEAWSLKDKSVHVYWDGEYVCHGGLTWSVESITDEIDSGWWTVSNV